VTDVELSGNHQSTTSKLLPYITVKKSRFFVGGEYSNRLIRSTNKNLMAAYQGNGFSSAKITSEVTKKDGNLQIHFPPR
jgi:outer membrane protein assembly factor BamA